MDKYDENLHVPKATIVNGGVTLVNSNNGGYNYAVSVIIDNQSFKIVSDELNDRNVRVITIEGIL